MLGRRKRSTWGGRRPGAGRPRKPPKDDESAAFGIRTPAVDPFWWQHAMAEELAASDLEDAVWQRCADLADELLDDDEEEAEVAFALAAELRDLLGESEREIARAQLAEM